MTSAAQTECDMSVVQVSGGHLWWPHANCLRGSGTEVSSEDGALRDDWARRLDPLSIRAVKCTEEARRKAGLLDPIERPNREGVCVGTALGAQQTRVRYATRLVSHGLAGTNPIDFPDSIDGAPAAHIALRWGLQGPSLTLVGGLDCACQALVFAARQLVFGLADRMHVVLGEVFEPRMRVGFTQLLARVDGADAAHLVPRGVVLALVLERQKPPPAVDSGIGLVGFIESSNGLSRLAPDERHGTMSPMGGEFDAVGIAGVVAVASAWLGLTAPNGPGVNACQDGLRGFSLTNSQWPNLAIVQTERK